MPLDPRDLELLRHSQLFGDLDEAAFSHLASLGARVPSQAEAQILFEEGEDPQCFYVVLSGHCEVIKSSEDSSFVEVIATVDAGSSVGELPLLRPGPRSATVRVAADTALVSFPIEPFRRELYEHERHAYLPLVLQLEAHLVEMITTMSKQTIVLLEAKNHALAHRQQVSVFIIYLISLLCGFMFVTQWLGSLTDGATGSTAITLPIILVIIAVLVKPIRQLGLPWSAYGITAVGWRESLRDGVLLSLPILVVATLIKLALTRLSPAHAGLPVLDFTHTLTLELGSGSAALRHFLIFNLAYIAVVVPVQELIARGLLQGLMERFIDSEHRTLLAVLISNLIFGAFHLYLSLGIAVATVVLGIYLGWIYVRTRNLIGVCVAHAVVGTWVLTVLRLQSMLL